MGLDISKAEIKKRIKVYEDSLKYWKEQARVAANEVKHCREYISKYKDMLKRA